MIEQTNQIKEDIPEGEADAKQLPVPSGYRILIALPKAEETYESGIVKASLTQTIEQVSTVVGFVLAIGPDAYKGEKYISGPWCKEGDFVLIGPYSGSRFKVHGQEFRMIDDDHVLGVVQDPRGYSRA
jgi:co-chaperonin GroES (HSP10)